MAEPIINAEIHGIGDIFGDDYTISDNNGFWTIPNELSLITNCEYVLYSNCGKYKYSDELCNDTHYLKFKYDKDIQITNHIISPLSSLVYFFSQSHPDLNIQQCENCVLEYLNLSHHNIENLTQINYVSISDDSMLNALLRKSILIDSLLTLSGNNSSIFNFSSPFDSVIEYASFYDNKKTKYQQIKNEIESTDPKSIANYKKYIKLGKFARSDGVTDISDISDINVDTTTFSSNVDPHLRNVMFNSIQYPFNPFQTEYTIEYEYNHYSDVTIDVIPAVGFVSDMSHDSSFVFINDNCSLFHSFNFENSWGDDESITITIESFQKTETIILCILLIL